MSIGGGEERPRTQTWLILLVLVSPCVLCFGSCYLFGTAPDGQRTLAKVPLGTRLSELDELAVPGWHSLSDVAEYRKPRGGEKAVKTWFGNFVVTEIGEFKSWKATDRERDAFTGEVRLHYNSVVIPDQLNPSFSIHYFYVDGVLKEKIYAQLPG